VISFVREPSRKFVATTPGAPRSETESDTTEFEEAPEHAAKMRADPVRTRMLLKSERFDLLVIVMLLCVFGFSI
jgi:hypothetical protein